MSYTERFNSCLVTRVCFGYSMRLKDELLCRLPSTKMETRSIQSKLQKVKTVMSPGNVMTSIFWDAGVLLVYYLNKAEAYYDDLLKRLREKIKHIRRGKLTRGVFFHQDSAPAHKSTVAMAAIQKCGFQLVDDPPYSYDYYIFTKMKMELGGHHFVSRTKMTPSTQKRSVCSMTAGLSVLM